jgi:hypothetical protein
MLPNPTQATLILSLAPKTVLGTNIGMATAAALPFMNVRRERPVVFLDIVNS